MVGALNFREALVRDLAGSLCCITGQDTLILIMLLSKQEYELFTP